MEPHSNVIYPNPFLPSGIEFEIDHESTVSLELLGASGDVIDCVIHKATFSKGVHKFESCEFSIPAIRYYRLTVVSEGRPPFVETKPFP